MTKSLTKINIFLLIGIVFNWLYVKLLVYWDPNLEKGTAEIIIILWPIIIASILTVYLLAKFGFKGDVFSKILFVLLCLAMLTSVFFLYMGFNLRHLSFGF